MSSGIVSIYVTFASDADARKLGRQMVDERLASCVNILGPAHLFQPDVPPENILAVYRSLK